MEPIFLGMAQDCKMRLGILKPCINFYHPI
jgi:hypothetical protein